MLRLGASAAEAEASCVGNTGCKASRAFHAEIHVRHGLLLSDNPGILLLQTGK
jgi:hypothetical protein